MGHGAAAEAPSLTLFSWLGGAGSAPCRWAAWPALGGLVCISVVPPFPNTDCSLVSRCAEPLPDPGSFRQHRQPQPGRAAGRAAGHPAPPGRGSLGLWGGTGGPCSGVVLVLCSVMGCEACSSPSPGAAPSCLCLSSEQQPVLLAAHELGCWPCWCDMSSRLPSEVQLWLCGHVEEGKQISRDWLTF